MRPCRGMGAIDPLKKPRKTRLSRTDTPQIIDVYARGGACRPCKKR